MKTELRVILLRFLGFSILAVIILFGYFRFEKYRTGPTIIDINLAEYSENKGSWKHLKAEIQNTKNISLNKKDLIIKDKKFIDEIIALSPGENIIQLELLDPFGKKRVYNYYIYAKIDAQEFPQNLSEARKLMQEKKEKETSQTLHDNL